jgi:uncharacterized repeat protein (TIGR02543 family)
MGSDFTTDRVIQLRKALERRKKVNKVLLISLALLLVISVGVVGCNGGVTRYNLTMAVNPVGGGTASDETDGSPYPAGTDVDIKAVATPPYQFVKWTASAGTLADENEAETTFTMPAQNVTVTAHFVGPLDHFRCYGSAQQTTPYIEEVVYLEDQFGTVNATASDEWPQWLGGTGERGVFFCTPVEKLHDNVLTPISNPDHHLTVYWLNYTEEPQKWVVEVDNQFGTQNLTVSGPVALAVPTQKVVPGGHELPCVDFEDPPLGTEYHVGDTFTDSGAVIDVERFQWDSGQWCNGSCGYASVANDGDAGGSGQEMWINNVNLRFDFGSPCESLSLLYGEYGGNLNIEINGDFRNFEDFADIDGLTIGGVTVVVDDLGDYKGRLTLSGVINSFAIGGQELCIDDVCPTVPLEPPVGLDHYLLYKVTDGTPVNVTVDMKDQFREDKDVSVYEPYLFANPVRKTHDGNVTEIVNLEAHLVIYVISAEFWEGPEVQVDNQFGEQTFQLFQDPVVFAVPSEKLSYELILP